MALQELAPKRFKGQSKEEALESIFKLVEGREPSNAGVTVRRITSMLMTTSMLTTNQRPKILKSFTSCVFLQEGFKAFIGHTYTATV